MFRFAKIPFLMTTMFAASMAAATATGCVNEIDRLTDCQDICARYQDCFDANYGIEACRNRCRDNADDSENFDQKVDQCENCLDDRSCVSSAFTCTAECATIVP